MAKIFHPARNIDFNVGHFRVGHLSWLPYIQVLKASSNNEMIRHAFNLVSNDSESLTMNLTTRYVTFHGDAR